MGIKFSPLFSQFATKAEVGASIGGIIGGFDTYTLLNAVAPASRVKGGYVVRNDETRVPAGRGQLYVNTGTSYDWVMTWPYAADDIVIEGGYTKLLSGITNAEAAFAILDAIGWVDVGGKPLHGIVARSVGATNPVPTFITTTTFTLAAAANPLTYWYNGIKKVVNTDQSTVLAGAAGLYFIYFNAALGTLLNSSVFPGFTNTSNVIICAVQWNGTDYGLVNDERHGHMRNLAWHDWAHNTVGARYKNGISLTASGTGAAATFSTTAGEIRDEDIIFDFPASSAFPVANAGRLFWQSAATVYSFDKTPSTVPFKRGVNNRPMMVRASDSTLVELASAVNRYINVFVYGTDDLHTPLYFFTESVDDATFGNNGYTSTTNARAIGFPILSGYMLSSELKPLYRLVIRADGVVQTMIASDDYRLVTSLPQSGGVGSLPATAITFTPAGNISATQVQAAIEELDSETSQLMIRVAIDGNGFALTTGEKTPYAVVPFNCVVTGWKLRISASDTMTLDVVTSATLAGSLASICGAGIKPNTSAATNGSGVDLTNWTTALTKDSLITVNCSVAPTSATWAVLILDIVRT